MDRPRNRQPRAPRGSSIGNGRGRGGRDGRPPQDRNSRWTAGTPQQAAGTVPTIQQVVPGASVFIILKEDQSTGQETQGVVQDLLTRGNHPRGIKVRLRGGLVGRVQRMGPEEAISTPTTAGNVISSPLLSGGAGFRSRIKYRDIRGDEDGREEPPQRSLADYLPAEFDEPASNKSLTHKEAAAARCPFCEEFEGDEVAVSYHIDQKHLS